MLPKKGAFSNLAGTPEFERNLNAFKTAKPLEQTIPNSFKFIEREEAKKKEKNTNNTNNKNNEKKKKIKEMWQYTSPPVVEEFSQEKFMERTINRMRFTTKEKMKKKLDEEKMRALPKKTEKSITSPRINRADTLHKMRMRRAHIVNEISKREQEKEEEIHNQAHLPKHLLEKRQKHFAQEMEEKYRMGQINVGRKMRRRQLEAMFKMKLFILKELQKRQEISSKMDFDEDAQILKDIGILQDHHTSSSSSLPSVNNNKANQHETTVHNTNTIIPFGGGDVNNSDDDNNNSISIDNFFLQSLDSTKAGVLWIYERDHESDHVYWRKVIADLQFNYLFLRKSKEEVLPWISINVSDSRTESTVDQFNRLYTFHVTVKEEPSIGLEKNQEKEEVEEKEEEQEQEEKQLKYKSYLLSAQDDKDEISWINTISNAANEQDICVVDI